MVDKLQHNFDDDCWTRERKARAERIELDRAVRAVSAGRVRRVAKPGRWRVYLGLDGRTVTEVFH